MRRALFAAGLLAVAVAAYWFATRPTAPPNTPPVVRPLWVYEAPEQGGFVAAPLITDDAIYLAAYHARGFRLAGAVYCLDPATRRPKWTFTDGGAMLPSVSSPALAGGRLYVGEGMHGHFRCHLYCLDAATGTKLWAHRADDHIESGPVVVDGVVFFAAGNDGVYALDAVTGAVKWHTAADFHVDATPCVAGGLVVVGTGPSRRFKAMQVLALDAATGNVRWRQATDLPAWAPPAAAGGLVVVPLGNGRLTESAQAPASPAGRVLAFHSASGREAWTGPLLPEAVFQQPSIRGDRVYYAARDGTAIAADATTGAEVWRTTAGGNVVSAIAAIDDRLYIATVGGRVLCLTAADGRERWACDLAVGGVVPRVYSPVRVAGGRVYVAGEFHPGSADNPGRACLYCLAAESFPRGSQP